jgi:ribonuclease D
MQPALWIANTDELNAALNALSGSDFVAIDTEFMRERTYYAALCLIQIATRDACVLIDPLALTDLQPLWNFLAERSRLKVLHSARQDLEVLWQAMSRAMPDTPSVPVPGPIFDTQIAAALLGYAAQVGYAPLVTERLSHTLPKGQTRTDWSQRPLTPEQLEYATDDVRYLVPLYEDLRAALDAQGRLSWLAEEGLEMEDPGLYRIEPVDAWRRLKGLDRLLPHQRATAKLLAAWRESRAMAKDKPRGWILSDESLRDMVERMPRNAEDLQAVRGLSANFLRKRTEEMLTIIAHGTSSGPQETQGVLPGRPEPEQTARVNRLMAAVRDEAARSRIAPELLATRRDIEQLVFAGRSDHLVQGWRSAVIGERLLALAAEGQPAEGQPGVVG